MTSDPNNRAETEPSMPAIVGNVGTCLAILGYLPALLAIRPSPRILVTACGAGEDVYCIAILIADAQAAAGRAPDFLILGTDLDAGAIESARAAVISADGARRLSALQRSRYLTADGDAWRVAPEIIANCQFIHQKIRNPIPLADLDLIYCSRLLKVFPQRTQRLVMSHLRDLLRSEGRLLVNDAEGMAPYLDLFEPDAAVTGLYRQQTSPALRIDPQRGLFLLRKGMSLIGDSLCVVVVDAEGRIVEFSRGAERLTGWSRLQAIGQPNEPVLQLSDPNGAADPNPIQHCLTDPHARGRAEERELLNREGRRLRVRINYSSLVENESIVGAMLILDDVTEQTLLAQELAYHRDHDDVTGLLNRREFEQRLSVVFDRARDDQASHVLCHVDVDQFKVINDTLGYQAGDDLLRRLAKLLRARLKASDILARVGGDEFGILIRNVDRLTGERVVERLLEAVRSFRFRWESQNYATTVSVGIVEITATTHSLARAFADADAACFEAKNAGRDRARSAAAADASIRRRHAEMSMVSRITQALDDDQFLLYFEDVMAVTTSAQAPGKVMYRELLVRMRGDDGELVPPAAFIAAAERYYLMAAIDRWVMAAAFKGIARLPDDGVIYAINISGVSLSDDQFLAHVLDSLTASGVAPHRICFEITETAAITRLSEATRFIDDAADLGCQFALDDFGAGMSSFSYLKNLPVQYVKIDGSFVRGMQDSSVDRGLVEVINGIGHEMGLITIAEHVEDAGALQMLAEIGVDWVQGHAIATGRPFDELLANAGVLTDPA